MTGSVTQQILEEHLHEGELVPGEEIGLDIDQVLMVDTSGTLVWLQFEALGLDHVETDPTVVYADHQVYQFDWRNSDDHRFLKSAADTYGAWFSKPGNGICHQVHKERFAKPGETLVGADSHTPTAGGFGMLAIGAGGLDVAVTMSGEPYYIQMPEVVNVRLEGELNEWVSAKDVILEMLRRLSVKGGLGRIFEYTGPGVETLSIPERTTITNMGTELGATTSVFPSDDQTRDYLQRLGRKDAYRELTPGEDATYDDEIVIDLGDIEPLVAEPSMPDNVVPVRDVAGKPVEQVVVGSCTNGSYEDVRAYAEPIMDHSVHEDVNAVVAPSSKQAAEMLSREGVVADLMAAGVMWSESTCGACIGNGHVPASGSTSVRTFNRNFTGRSGIEDDSVFLASPETAAVTSVAGELIDPRDFADEYGTSHPGVIMPDEFTGSRVDLLPPGDDNGGLHKGPNIGDVPLKDPLAPTESGAVLLKMGDDITTDHILPGRSDIMMYRSNIDKLSEYTLERVDASFAERAKAADGGWLVAGENYGQGSSREHAALCPMHLGVHGVLAKSFARIHKANLFNFGLLPLEFVEPSDYSRIEEGASLRAENLVEAVRDTNDIIVINESTGVEIVTRLIASERERELILAGGKLPYTKANLDA